MSTKKIISKIEPEYAGGRELFMKQDQSVSGFRKYWLVVFLTAGLVYAILYIRGVARNVEQDLVISWPPLLIAFCLQLCFWALSSLLWQGLIKNFSHHKISFFDSYFQLCLVNLGKYFPGKVWGMVARGSYLKQRYVLSSQVIIQTTYVEQIFLLGSGVSLASVLYGAINSSLVAFALAFVLSIATVTGSAHLRTVLIFIEKAMPRLALVERFGSSDKTLTLLQSLRYSLLYAVVWILLGGVLYAIYLSLFPVSFTIRHLITTVLSCIIGLTAGFLAIFAPGGVGVREAVSSAMLGGFMPWADAVMVTLVFRIWLSSLELGSMGISYLIIRVARPPLITKNNEDLSQRGT